MSISVMIGLFYVGICMVYGDIGWNLMNRGDEGGGKEGAIQLSNVRETGE